MRHAVTSPRRPQGFRQSHFSRRPPCCSRRVGASAGSRIHEVNAARAPPAVLAPGRRKRSAAAASPALSARWAAVLRIACGDANSRCHSWMTPAECAVRSTARRVSSAAGAPSAGAAKPKAGGISQCSSRSGRDGPGVTAACRRYARTKLWTSITRTQCRRKSTASRRGLSGGRLAVPRRCQSCTQRGTSRRCAITAEDL